MAPSPGRQWSTAGPGRWLLALLAVLVVVAAFLPGFVPQVAPGRAGTADRAERVDVSPGATAEDLVPGVPFRGTVPGAALTADDRVVLAILADLQRFWTDELGELDTPTGGYAAVGVGATGSDVLCLGGDDTISFNAYYCHDEDGIVWDATSLVPSLRARSGDAGLASALAHEFGHAVQARLRPEMFDRDTPTLITEAQADCAAGAFLAWAAEGGTEHLRLGQDSMARALTPVLDLADPPGVDVLDPAAHGSAVDRATAWLTGARDGTAACWELGDELLGRSTLNVGGGVAGDSGTDPAAARSARSSDEIITAGTRSAAAFADRVGLGGSVDADRIAPEHAPGVPDVDTARRIGTFAPAAAAVQRVGFERIGSRPGAACFLGAWTAWTTESGWTLVSDAGLGSGASPGRDPEQLGTVPGDADQALRLLSREPGVRLTELSGFVTGFQDGYDPGIRACQ
ncbi:neutral zinc metallopeptidase [Nakamurella leprariae]|uniref:Peptidase n=1 Tax=Nakamurella leprariae TaxID=2803911 RepID=A0A938Y6C2_9ACTN|nr:hypothetical protein [Nakamurella leprariae]MBM9466846.1 hypothetical protein [Nakamurella leprariae]